MSSGRSASRLRAKVEGFDKVVPVVRPQAKPERFGAKAAGPPGLVWSRALGEPRVSPVLRTVGWLGRTTGTTCDILLAGRIDQTKQNDPISCHHALSLRHDGLGRGSRIVQDCPS